MQGSNSLCCPARGCDRHGDRHAGGPSSRDGGRRAIAAGIIVGFAVGSNVANLGAIATSLAGTYGVSLTVVGLFTTSLFVTHTAVQVPGGQAIDRFGARRLAFMSLLTIIVGSGVAMIASDPALVVVARAITGAGTGIGFIAGSEYVRAAGGSPYAQGLFGGFGVAGGGFALAVVPLLERAVGWRSPFVLAVALALVALAALLFGSSARGGGPSGLHRARHGPPGDRRPQAVPHRSDAHGRVRSQRCGRQLGRHPARAPRLLDGVGEHARRPHPWHQRRQQAPGWMADAEPSAPGAGRRSSQPRGRRGRDA